jgi:hypothetical protein
MPIVRFGAVMPLRPELPIAALLCLALPIGATQGAPQAPELFGAYDSHAQLLVLNWQPESWAPEGTQYLVHRNAQLIAQTTADTIIIDVSAWQGVNDYTLSVKYPDQEVSAPGNAFRVVKDVQMPAHCEVASVTIYTQPPGASYAVYPDCIAR